MQAGTNITIQSRDLDILGDLSEFRGVTARQLSRMYFEDRQPAATKRLGKLRRAGLLFVDQSRHLQISQVGYEVLREKRASTRPWSAIRARQQQGTETLVHDQAILEAKVNLALALQDQTAMLETFTTDTIGLTESRASQQSFTSKRLIPDAYIVIADGQERQHFFLEVDRSTEPLGVIQTKAKHYRARYRSGKFDRLLGQPDTPLRVLFLCPSARRRDNMARVLLDLAPPILSQCWFANTADFAGEPLGKIWLTPHALRRTGGFGRSPGLKSL